MSCRYYPLNKALNRTIQGYVVSINTCLETNQTATFESRIEYLKKNQSENKYVTPLKQGQKEQMQVFQQVSQQVLQAQPIQQVLHDLQPLQQSNHNFQHTNIQNQHIVNQVSQPNQLFTQTQVSFQQFPQYPQIYMDLGDFNTYNTQLQLFEQSVQQQRLYLQTLLQNVFVDEITQQTNEELLLSCDIPEINYCQQYKKRKVNDNQQVRILQRTNFTPLNRLESRSSKKYNYGSFYTQQSLSRTCSAIKLQRSESKQSEETSFFGMKSKFHQQFKVVMQLHESNSVSKWVSLSKLNIVDNQQLESVNIKDFSLLLVAYFGYTLKGREQVALFYKKLGDNMYVLQADTLLKRIELSNQVTLKIFQSFGKPEKLIKIHPFTPQILDEKSFTTVPPIYELQQMTEEQICKVKKLQIKTQYGEVEFLKEVDLRGLILDEVVNFQQDLIEFYPTNKYTTPNEGEGINVPCNVTFYKFGHSRPQFQKVDLELDDNFMKLLAEWVKQNEMKIVEYKGGNLTVFLEHV